ncbi:tetraacyldisaccharide 4'-kinase [Candidatus Pelagibacter sp. HIMB1623]|uniref:tetraacyldisaccharide 4'-kinase n=1 Tax=Candidatus Pelagibacter sp. HIMB1623 TaxID=3413358 RepID=UPI003F86E79D
MKLNEPKFWQDKNFISFLLSPLSLVAYFFNFLKKILPKKKFKIKTICIGNIYVGGTGKTSLAIEIHNILKKKYKTVFIKKNYLDQKDEIKLLENSGKIISTDSRSNSLNIAEKKRFEIAILDDGFQQKNIYYDLKILCFNSKKGIGNGMVLPSGPLRESFNEINNCDLIFINGENKNNKLIKKLKFINKNINIFEGKYFPTNLKKINTKKNFLIFCGIGNPHEFESTLSKLKFIVKRKFIYPDHYQILDKDINEMKKLAKKEGLSIITTEKDYLRLHKKQKKNITFLKTRLKINNLNKLKKILLNIDEKI